MFPNKKNMSLPPRNQLLQAEMAMVTQTQLLKVLVPTLERAAVLPLPHLMPLDMEVAMEV
jgi:hypothetical protein